MKFINRITRLTCLMLLSALLATAQTPASSQYANPSVVDITKVGGGNSINQSAQLVYLIKNASSGAPGTGIVSVGSINVQVGFPAQFGLQDGTNAALTAQLALQGWSVTYIETGASGTIIVTNTQAIAEDGDLPITLPVVGFGLGTGTTTVTVERNLPVVIGDQTAFDNVTNSPFTVTQPLPVKLLSFTATKRDMTSVLDWVTSSEQNNKGFTIERSTDGTSFSPIGFVSSNSLNGNSNMKQGYSFIDKTPVTGKNFYRLKQTDYDGRYEYSTVRMIELGMENSIVIYPNPVKDYVYINGLSGNETVVIYDAMGRTVHQQKAGNASINIATDKLSEGMYKVQIVDLNGKISAAQKLVKIK